MHLLSGKTLESRRAQRPQTIIQNGSGGFAMEFNGTDEYLQIALPSELVTNGDFEAGSNTFSWLIHGGTADWANTETGKTGNYCLKITKTLSALNLYRSSVTTVGKKYKFTMRYKCNSTVTIGNYNGTGLYGGFPATSEWNTVTKIFTCTQSHFYVETSADIWIDYISIKEDQGFDLNKDQEQILHSKNWDFERTLGAEIATGTVTIGSKYVVTAGTVEGNAVGTEFLAVTNATTLDASNKVKEIPNLVTNGTFETDTNWGKDSGWSIDTVNKKAVGSNVSGNLYQASKVKAGKRYRVSYQVIAYTAGQVRPRLGEAVGTGRTSTGTFTDDITAGSTGESIEINGIGFTGEIDNIHIYEIPEWTASGNHSCDVSTLDKSGATGQSFKVTASGAGNSSNCVTLPSVNLESCVSGKKYTLQGEARLDPVSLSYGSNLVINGDFSTSANWTISNATDFNITSGVAVKSGLPLGVIYQGASVGVTYTANKVYKVILTVSGLTGYVSIDINGGTSVSMTTEATHTIYLVAGTNAALGLRIVGSVNTLFTVDNISSFEATPITLTSQLGTKSVTSSALSIVQGNFTKVVLNFEATASEVNQDLKLWLSGTGSVFVDKLSLTQKYDVYYSFRNTVSNFTAYRSLFGKYVAASAGYFGDYLWYEITTGKIEYFCSDGDGTTSGRSVKTTNGLSSGVYRTIGVVTKFDEAKIYSDGSELSASSVTRQYGKVIVTSPLSFGALISPSPNYYLNGQISHIQIWRFENISQSTFNSALTGLQFPTGGGAEEVLRLTFQDGTSINNTLKDYSPKGQTVTGVNIDSTNRKRVN